MFCHSGGRREEVVYDDTILAESLSKLDWHIEEDPMENYELLLRKLQACAEHALRPRTTNVEHILKATKEMLGKRMALRLDLNASHIERQLANTSCRKALQEELQRYRQKNVSEAAQGKRSVKKCRRDFRDYTVPLTALLNEDGIVMSSHHHPSKWN